MQFVDVWEFASLAEESVVVSGVGPGGFTSPAFGSLLICFILVFGGIIERKKSQEKCLWFLGYMLFCKYIQHTSGRKQLQT